MILERVQVTLIILNETNHQGNQRLLLVRNAAVEAANKTRTIKSAVKPEITTLHPRSFVGMLGGSPSIKMTYLSSSFKY